MARTSTDADERFKQRRDIQREVASELGVDHVTIKTAEEHRRATRSVRDIKERTLDLEDVDIQPIGVLLAQVADFKVTRGVTAQLNLVTNAIDFGPLLLDASIVSSGELLVCALYRIPRAHGLDMSDEVGGDRLNAETTDA